MCELEHAFGSIRRRSTDGAYGVTGTIFLTLQKHHPPAHILQVELDERQPRRATDRRHQSNNIPSRRKSRLTSPLPYQRTRLDCVPRKPPSDINYHEIITGTLSQSPATRRRRRWILPDAVSRESSLHQYCDPLFGPGSLSSAVSPVHV